MNELETAAEVRRLLELFPGVTVVRVQSPLRFLFTVQEQRSLARFARIALAANVPLHVETDWDWKGAEDDPASIWYEYRVPRADVDGVPPSRLQVLGFYLAKHLLKMQRLTAADAKSLCVKWNCDLG